MLGRLYEFADVLRHHNRKRQMAPDAALGRRGEDIAHRHLQRSGITIVARNYRMSSGRGEIDLIGWENDTLVFIEVKSRGTDQYGAPDRAIGREYARRAEVSWQKVRFDTVSVVFSTPPSVSHVRDVFGPPSAA